MTRPQQLAFIASVAPAAQRSQRISGVPASVTLAQAILESNWGCSALARRYNNYFGIKARQGEDYCEFKTHEYLRGKDVIVKARFRKFRSVAESFHRHCALLATLARYRPAMAAAGDPLKFAIELRNCGYSTDPAYAKKLTALMKDFALVQYDQKGIAA